MCIVVLLTDTNRQRKWLRLCCCSPLCHLPIKMKHECSGLDCSSERAAGIQHHSLGLVQKEQDKTQDLHFSGTNVTTFTMMRSDFIRREKIRKGRVLLNWKLYDKLDSCWWSFCEGHRMTPGRWCHIGCATVTSWTGRRGNADCDAAHLMWFCWSRKSSQWWKHLWTQSWGTPLVLCKITEATTHIHLSLYMA